MEIFWMKCKIGFQWLSFGILSQKIMHFNVEEKPQQWANLFKYSPHTKTKIITCYLMTSEIIKISLQAPAKAASVFVPLECCKLSEWGKCAIFCGGLQQVILHMNPIRNVNLQLSADLQTSQTTPEITGKYLKFKWKQRQTDTQTNRWKMHDRQSELGTNIWIPIEIYTMW